MFKLVMLDLEAPSGMGDPPSIPMHISEADSLTPTVQADALDLELNAQKLEFHTMLVGGINDSVNLDAGLPQRNNADDESRNVRHNNMRSVV